MSAVIMSSQKPRAALEADIRPRVAACKAAGVVPAIALVRVGENIEDLSYEQSVMKKADALGVSVVPVVLSADATQADIEKVLGVINADLNIHGCLLFRPLPPACNEAAVCDCIAVGKDIDCMSTASLGKLLADSDEVFPPSTAAACMEMLDAYDIELAGKRAVVVGRSLVVGKPLAAMLLRRNATVTVCHSRTENLPQVMREADIVVCATGRAKAYGAECFRPGQTVVDIGINFVDGTLCGDVDFDAVEPIVDAITPVPGGVGTVTMLMTLSHAVTAAERTLA